MGEDGQKMSKSRGNVVNPDEILVEFGADAFRLYEMFMGAFDQPIPWSTSGLNGMSRFLCRVWDRFKDAGWRAVVAAGLAPISVGLIAASAVVLTIATSINVPACLVVLATAAMTYWTRWSPLWAIAAGALLGLAGLI